MSKALQNRVFVSTRPEGHNEELKQLFEKEGATLLEMPTIAIGPAKMTPEKEEILRHLEQFTWIVFSSANGVRHFFQQLKQVTGSYYLPPFIKLASVGIKTDKVLMEFGYKTAIENPGNTGEELASEMLMAVQNQDVILFAEGNLARRTVALKLSQIATCQHILVYQNVLPDSFNEKILNQIIRGKYDGIILTSPSAFNNLALLLNNKIDLQKLKLICIGTTTANEVISKGISPMAIAPMANAKGILEATINSYQATIKS